MTQYIILISGVARSGKDTLAKALSFEIQARTMCETPVLKFANPLRRALKASLLDVGIDYVDPWTEDAETKTNLRPLMVEFGRYCRSLNRDVFVNATLRDIERTLEDTLLPCFPIVADLRYLNEVQRVRSWASNQKHKTEVIRAQIGRSGMIAANEEEARSLADLDCNDMPDFQWSFDEADFDGIQAFAQRIATKLFGQPAIPTQPRAEATNDAQMLDAVIGLKLTIERMEARLKRLELNRHDF